MLLFILFNAVSYENEYLAVGRTPLIICNHMQLIQHLLVNTDLPVYEICQQVGYQNPSQFVRTFRKKFGMTPIQYRNRERNKQETINI